MPSNDILSWAANTGNQQGTKEMGYKDSRLWHWQGQEHTIILLSWIGVGINHFCRSTLVYKNGWINVLSNIKGMLMNTEKWCTTMLLNTRLIGSRLNEDSNYQSTFKNSLPFEVSDGDTTSNYGEEPGWGYLSLWTCTVDHSWRYPVWPIVEGGVLW